MFCLRTILQEHKDPFFSYIMFGIDSVTSSLPCETNLED